MGISGLLPLLKKASKNSHVRKFSGCTAAIDAYGWLHKGAFGCAEKLGKGEPTTAYITYCMKYIQVLLDNGIKPILVLDGRNLPSKEHTEKQRRKKRDENRKLARKYVQEGKKKEAWECFTKCVDITPAMAREFIKVLRTMKIDYVVAPYEADAQLAYLALSGIADFIITEDSDLVLFGCPKIFFKMNVNGDGVVFELSKLSQCFGQTPKSFSFERFRWMCILSGCDYLPSIPGIGLGRAKKVIDEAKDNDIRKMIVSIPNILVKLHVEVTEEYIKGFFQAENTFLYQLVFDTRKRRLLPLNPYPEGLGPEDLPFAGSYDTKNISIDLALGNVDLHTLEKVDSFEPLKSGYTSSSIWSPYFRLGEKKGRLEMTESKALGNIGMQISSGSGSSSKKKRPLTVTNLGNEDNFADDTDLMKLYEDEKPVSEEVASDSSLRKAGKDYNDDSLSFEDDKNYYKREIDSPSTFKRRRIMQRNAEPELETPCDNSPSCITRRSRVIPFLKSPSADDYRKEKIHVKSQYFRSEEETATVKQKRNISNTKMKNDEMEDSSEDDDDTLRPDLLPANLNIYSQSQYNFNESQDSTLSDISASQRSTSYVSSSQNSDLSNSLPRSSCADLKPCSVVFKKTDIVPCEITLDVDDEDNAFGSRGGSHGTNNTNLIPAISLSHDGSSSINALKRGATNTPSVPLVKPSSRRQGLFRSVKKDSRQPSVREMFMRRKSAQ